MMKTAEIDKLIAVQEKNDKRTAARYDSDVWSQLSKSAYISDQAQRCADFALRMFTVDYRFRTFELENPHGKRFPKLGVVYFRHADPIPGDHGKFTPAIANIALHPSLRRNGFLTRLMLELSARGVAYLAIQCVENESWEKALLKKCATPESGVFLIDSDGNFGIRL